MLSLSLKDAEGRELILRYNGDGLRIHSVQKDGEEHLVLILYSAKACEAFELFEMFAKRGKRIYDAFGKLTNLLN